MSEAAADKLMRARCRLITREPWYGHMAMSIAWKESDMSWVEDEESKTLGMRITSTGEVQAFFYGPWVERTDLKKIYGTIEHAINHLIRLHTLRSGGRDDDTWALATDAVVNGEKSNPRIGYRDDTTNSIILPQEDMFFIQSGWPADETAEAYYELLIKGQGGQGKGKNKSKSGQGDPNQQGQGQGQGQGQKDKNKQKGQGQGGGQGDEDEEDQNQNGEGEGEEGDESQQGNGSGDGQKKNRGKQPGYYQSGSKKGHCIDDHESWKQSDISQDEARQVIHDMVREATEKSQGTVPGHLKEAIEALGKPVVRWREVLRRYLGRHVGNRRRTYSRAERRHQQFGLKGVSHHAAATVNVIVDTSGSIGAVELEQFFAEIEMISARAKVMVLQWDAEFQGYEKYRKGAWRGWAVNGRGGTDMVGAQMWIEKNAPGADVIILLTDGYTGYREPKQPYPFICVITTDQAGPTWGHVIHMKKYE